MAKYSTGGGGGGREGDACELCGSTDGPFKEARVAGATLLVCPSCAPHGESSRQSRSGTSSSESSRERKRRAARSLAELRDAQQADAHWAESGTNYEEDRLPYLKPGYGDIARDARREAGLQLEELARELEVPEEELLAIEEGRAARAGVGGSLVERLEERFDIELIE